MRQQAYPHLVAHADAHRLGTKTLERAARVFAEESANGRFLFAGGAGGALFGEPPALPRISGSHALSRPGDSAKAARPSSPDLQGRPSPPSRDAEVDPVRVGEAPPRANRRLRPLPGRTLIEEEEGHPGERAMQLAWDESLSVGVPEIDRQHQEIVRQLRQLGEDVLGPVTPEELLPKVERLLHCVERHFETEEVWMRARGYPHAASHLASHRLAQELLERAVRRCGGPGAAERVKALLQRMVSWYLIHLRSEDLRLGRYAAAQGPGGGP
jgi:hemerythrin